MYSRYGAFLLKTFVRRIGSKEEHFITRAGLHKDPRKTLFIHDKHVVSYGDFLKWTGRCANLLSEKYRISKGDRVLCRTSKTLDSVALYMACLQLGAIYIPVNPSYTRSETEHYVKDSTPKLMVTCDSEKDKVFEDRIAYVQHEEKLSKESQNAVAVLDVENVESDDVACVCYTSGTTGLPKGAMLTHGSLSSNAEALIHAWRFTGNDIVVERAVLHRGLSEVVTGSHSNDGRAYLLQAWPQVERIFEAVKIHRYLQRMRGISLH